MKIVIAVLALILILIILCYRGKEQFSDDFLNAKPSTEFMKYLVLNESDDPTKVRRTLVRQQRGNSQETVLLLHNSPMSAGIWRPLYITMQKINMTGVKTPNLISYDLHGHGSAWTPVDPKFNDLNVNNTAWSLDLFTQDAKKVYDNIIGQGKIKVCGFGFGGIVAQEFALKYPDLVSHLIILQTGIKPMPARQAEIDYLAGPNGWIAKNPNVSYLTNEEKYVQKTLCEWFYLPNIENCNSGDTGGRNDQLAPQFNLTADMWRRGSSTTALQTAKLLISSNIESKWNTAGKLPFTIHLLSATEDPLAPPDRMVETYTAIYNNNRELIVAFDIVQGRHGFTIMNPNYIAGIICGDCEKKSAQSTYLTQSNQGF